MDNSLFFEWKSFSIPTDRLSLALKTLIGEASYDGLVCNEEGFSLVFKDAPSQSQTDEVTNYWNSVTEAQFAPTLRETISTTINEASAFGGELILDFAVENVEMGITQAGKTMQVADYCADVQRYLESGSLYAAISKIDALIAAGVPSDLSPFVTEERLTTYKTKIQDYLG